MNKLLWLYVVLLPLMNIPAFRLAGRKVLFCDLAAVLLFFVFAALCIFKKKIFRISLAGRSALIMAALFAPSLLNARPAVSGIAEFSGLAYLIAVFLLTPAVIDTREKLVEILYVWTITAASVSLAGLFVFCAAVFTGRPATGEFLMYGHVESVVYHFPRLQATFGVPNMFFAYLHVSLVVAGMLFFLEQKRQRRIFIVAAAGIIIISVFLTGSRRVAGLLLTAFLMLFLFRKAALLKAVKVIVFSGFLVFLAAYIATSIFVVFPLEKGFRPNYSYSLHFLSSAASVNMFKRHPIIGVGLGAYNNNFKDNVDWNWVNSSFDFNLYSDYRELAQRQAIIFDPHSVFLGTLAETGTIGFLGLIYFFLRYMILLIKRFRRNAGYDSGRIVAGCALAGFLGFLLNGLTIDILSMRHFWIMMAIGISSLHLTGDYKQC
jgi:O-antigen ligase